MVIKIHNSSMKRLVTFILALLISVAFISCTHDVGTDVPRPIRKLISEQKGNCLTSVQKYHYQGKEVYLFESSSCADYPATVYDVKGNVICMPSGGLSGAGDGNCPYFYEEATNKEDVWKK